VRRLLIVILRDRVLPSASTVDAAVVLLAALTATVTINHSNTNANSVRVIYYN